MIVQIPSGRVLEGWIPSNKQKFVDAWVVTYQDELMADWQLAINADAVFKIAPLNEEVMMKTSVVSVQPAYDYNLIVIFDNSNTKLSDVSPYLDKGTFQELKYVSYFKRVSIAFGSVEWSSE